MADAQGSSKHVGTIIGVVLVVGAVISIFLIDWKNDLPQSTPPIRPLKTVVVAVPFTSMVGKYPGKVRANQEVDLAFQVSGPLVELPIKKGQVIEAGQLLARIDSRDFEHALEAKTAMQTKAKSDLEKITQLLARDAST